MFIRCPACHTLFRIQPKQLKAARGQVRCGSCQAVFDGLESLVNREELNKEELTALLKQEAASRQWQLPFDEALASPHAATADSAVDTKPSADTIENVEEQPDSDEIIGTAPAESPILSNVPAPAEAEVESGSSVPAKALFEDEPLTATPTVVEPLEVDEPPAIEKPAPAEKRSPRYTLSGHEPEAVPSHTSSRLSWGFGSLLMIAVLAGQLVWFNRDTLALDSRWRPWLERVCQTAGCELPPLRDPGAIEMVDRNVQSHPEYQGALYITATLVNQAPFAQPYPQVELSMTDLDQKRIAWRRFLPAEYLDNGNGQGLIAPGASVRLKLEIADPGQEAVGFEFKFF